MANSFKGFKNLVATFESSSGVSVGDIVTISSTGKVKTAIDSDDIIGVCISQNGERAGVLFEGYVELGYTGATPTYGYRNILASSKETVAIKDTPVAGKKRLVLKVDTANKKVGFIL